MPEPQSRQLRIALFGHFGAGNFGNEATLQAMLWNLRRLLPNAELMCITTFPAKVIEDYGIAAIPISESMVRPWNIRNPLLKLVRRLFVGIPSEMYRWFKALKTLWHTDMFIVVGTGLLTDSFCIGGWGPYSVFKWSLAAKLCRCRLCFVSAGAGPLDRRVGRALIRSALSLATFRSFRDRATLDYLRRIGFRRDVDRVFPDLAFSLAPEMLPSDGARRGRRPVVGVGLMTFDGFYGIEKTTKSQYASYLETLVRFVNWLLDRGYDVRLLVGDTNDAPTIAKFKSLLREHSVPEDRIIAEPVTSTQNLLSQIAATDFVVATRFHNVLLSLMLNKPAIAISFHHKCSSLMSQMGLSDYCQDIQKLNGESLAEQFCRLSKNAVILKQSIAAKAAEYRKGLDEQYSLFLRVPCPLSVEPSGSREGEFAATTSERESL